VFCFEVLSKLSTAVLDGNIHACDWNLKVGLRNIIYMLLNGQDHG
jgi:hypothetical protein